MPKHTHNNILYVIYSQFYPLVGVVAPGLEAFDVEVQMREADCLGQFPYYSRRISFEFLRRKYQGILSPNLSKFLHINARSNFCELTDVIVEEGGNGCELGLD